MYIQSICLNVTFHPAKHFSITLRSRYIRGNKCTTLTDVGKRVSFVFKFDFCILQNLVYHFLISLVLILIKSISQYQGLFSP